MPAAQVGLTVQKADAYVTEFGRSLVVRVVGEGMVEKLRADFEANGIPLSDGQIHETLSQPMAAAVTQVRSSARCARERTPMRGRARALREWDPSGRQWHERHHPFGPDPPLTDLVQMVISLVISVL